LSFAQISRVAVTVTLSRDAHLLYDRALGQELS